MNGQSMTGCFIRVSLLEFPDSATLALPLRYNVSLQSKISR